MSESMIERVARALAEEDGDLYEANAVFWKGMARAAIKAMREPTEAMERAGDIPGWDDAVSIGHSADVWRAMIDAALSEGRE